MVQVVRADGMRVEVDAPQVHDPRELRRVAHDDLVRGPPRGERELHRLDPRRPGLRGPLLEEELALGAVDVALHRHRPPVDASQRAVGHRHVVTDQVELRVARLREEHLVRIGDGHLDAVELEDLLLPPGHTHTISDGPAGTGEPETATPAGCTSCCRGPPPSRPAGSGTRWDSVTSPGRWACWRGSRARPP